MKYTRKYFKENMPKWKRDKDPILVRIFYRPVSFCLSAWCANHDVNANTVSYFSILIGVLSCALFLIHNYTTNVIAAALINVWLLLDCTDGNLARSYKRQAFGEFADGISSYILVSLLCTTISLSVYYQGGIVINKGNPWIIIVGAFASLSDTLMRLIYQKYKMTERELSDEGVLKIEKDVIKDHAEVSNIKVRIKQELGIGGLLPIAILLAAFFLPWI